MTSLNREEEAAAAAQQAAAEAEEAEAAGADPAAAAAVERARTISRRGEEARGGFVLRAKSDEYPARRRSLVERTGMKTLVQVGQPLKQPRNDAEQPRSSASCGGGGALFAKFESTFFLVLVQCNFLLVRLKFGFWRLLRLYPRLLQLCKWGQRLKRNFFLAFAGFETKEAT